MREIINHNNNRNLKSAKYFGESSIHVPKLSNYFINHSSTITHATSPYSDPVRQSSNMWQEEKPNFLMNHEMKYEQTLLPTCHLITTHT